MRDDFSYFLAVVGQGEVIFFGVGILLFFILMVLAFFFVAWTKRHERGISPYSGMPLRKAEDLPYESKKKILKYLYDLSEYDNRLFELKKAVVCRETGRVFQDAVTWYGTVPLDWTFIQKRFPGNYVSWGSLNDTQQGIIRSAHYTLDRFQTEHSSTEPAPRSIEKEYIYVKPGPLYVDLQTKVLVGWQRVPGTEFELLIVQRPKESMT